MAQHGWVLRRGRGSLLASSMGWWREADASNYPVDDRVPPFAGWPHDGIVGRIGRGPDEGEWVLVDPVWDSSTGGVEAYELELPRDLYDTDGHHVMDDGCVDVPRPVGVGGLIDYLTTALDVEWSTDAALVAETWKRERPFQ